MDWQALLDTKIGSFALEKLLWAALIALIGLVLMHYIMKLTARAVRRAPLDRTLHSFLLSGIRMLLLFTLALMVCGALGIPVSSLLALFGVVGLAISLSIQGWLGNLASGLLILFTKPFGVGDYIESGAPGSGVAGTVKSISLIYTRLATPDNKLVFVPNSQLTGAQITNYTHSATRRVEVNFSAPAEASVTQVRELALGAARIDGIQDEPAPFVGYSGQQDGTASYVLRCWCQNSDYWDIYYALTERVKQALDGAGLAAPTKHVNVRIEKQDKNYTSYSSGSGSPDS